MYHLLHQYCIMKETQEQDTKPLGLLHHAEKPL